MLTYDVRHYYYYYYYIRCMFSSIKKRNEINNNENINIDVREVHDSEDRNAILNNEDTKHEELGIARHI